MKSHLFLLFLFFITVPTTSHAYISIAAKLERSAYANCKSFNTAKYEQREARRQFNRLIDAPDAYMQQYMERNNDDRLWSELSFLNKNCIFSKLSGEAFARLTTSTHLKGEFIKSPEEATFIRKIFIKHCIARPLITSSTILFSWVGDWNNPLKPEVHRD
jgi:hypothetical protein